MGCVCIQKLKTAAENLKKLPLAKLASLIPANLPTPQMGRLSSSLMGSAAASASATARAQMMAKIAAQARLSASLNMNVVAQLEAMAQMQQAFGVSPLSANAGARLSTAIQSMNANMPPLIAVLLDQLAPLAEKLAALSAMLSTTAVVNRTVGLNLAQPGAAAKLPAALTAHAAAVATASATATADVAATANLATHVRLVAAAKRLGIDLLAPGGAAKLSAAISASAKLSLPPLTISPAQMGALAAALSQISAAQSALNVNFAAPNAASLLAAALAPLLASMNAVGALPLGATATANASANAAAQAAMSAAASSQANLQALAAMNFQGMSLPPLPKLGNLSLAATLTETLSNAAGVSAMQSHPCSSCPVAGRF